ncbi:ATP-binding protein [Streptomyces cyslabdanicus]|uniref:ATP-binding protein n=1 Tax=Streptomyces cyslabdanicus TaxID=1470456 RepID=UPI004043E4EA
MTATMAAPVLPSRHVLPRTHDAMAACFAISARSEGQDIPDRDAQRVSAMRRLARARLEYCRLSPLADDIELIVSELVTNAIAHSRGSSITMMLGLDHGLLTLEVKDETGRHPEIRQPADDAENGRGLILVQAITEQHGGEWGTRPDGTNTWCTIPVLPQGDQ